jgi:hypothetical protein
MLVFSAILSLALMAFTYFAFRRERTPRLEALMLPAAGGVIFGYCLFLPALLIHAVLVIPALCLWKGRHWPASTLLAYMVLAAVGSLQPLP